MKRSLAVGILLIGVATTIILNECTREEVVQEAVVEPQVSSVTFEEAEIEPVAEEIEEEILLDDEYDIMIYQACKGTVVDPYLAIAISRLETGHYTSRAFEEGYNFGGITVESGVKSFDSLEDGLEQYISLLEWYHSEGLDTPEEMQPVYCPPYEDWDEIVTELYDYFTNETRGS